MHSKPACGGAKRIPQHWKPSKDQNRAAILPYPTYRAWIELFRSTGWNKTPEKIGSHATCSVAHRGERHRQRSLLRIQPEVTEQHCFR